MKKVANKKYVGRSWERLQLEGKPAHVKFTVVKLGGANLQLLWRICKIAVEEAQL